MVLQRNGAPLPPEAFFVLRYQKAASFTHGAYSELMDEQDRACLPWLKTFEVWVLGTRALSLDVKSRLLA